MAGSLLLSIFTLFSGVVAMLVCYYAFRFNRLIGSPLLRFVGVGFGLLGFGLLVESGSALYLGLATVEFLNTIRRYETLYILFNIGIQGVAYFVIATGYAVAAYARSLRSRSASQDAARTAASIVGVAAATPVAQLAVLNYYLFAFTQVAVVLLLAFIIFQGILIYLRGHNTSSLLVLSSFVLVLLAHIVMLYSGLYLSGALYLLATGIQLGGFVALLAFLIRSGRIGSA
jgi:hypothetical protein